MQVMLLLARKSILRFRLLRDADRDLLALTANLVIRRLVAKHSQSEEDSMHSCTDIESF